LEIAQWLYEKKLITYPRTDSRVISTDVLEEVPKVLNGIYKNPEYRDYVLKIKEMETLRSQNLQKGMLTTARLRTTMR